jgi:hypothetical protein
LCAMGMDVSEVVSTCHMRPAPKTRGRAQVAGLAIWFTTPVVFIRMVPRLLGTAFACYCAQWA